MDTSPLEARETPTHTDMARSVAPKKMVPTDLLEEAEPGQAARQEHEQRAIRVSGKHRSSHEKLRSGVLAANRRNKSGSEAHCRRARLPSLVERHSAGQCEASSPPKTFCERGCFVNVKIFDTMSALASSFFLMQTNLKLCARMLGCFYLALHCRSGHNLLAMHAC